MARGHLHDCNVIYEYLAYKQPRILGYGLTDSLQTVFLYAFTNEGETPCRCTAV